MIHNQKLAMVLVCVLSLSLVVGAAAGSSIDSDAQETIVTVDEDGDATWEIRVRTALETESDVDEFQTWETEVEQNNEEYREEYQQQFGSIVAIAEDELDRSMDIQDVTVTAEQIASDEGVTRISFTWTNFATVDSGSIYAGDVFHDGYTIDENETLVIKGHDGYEAGQNTNADSVDDDSFLWEGSQSFAEDEPSVAFHSSEQDSSDVDVSDEEQPGFGIIVALTAVLMAAAIVQRRE